MRKWVFPLSRHFPFPSLVYPPPVTHPVLFFTPRRHVFGRTNEVKRNAAVKAQDTTTVAPSFAGTNLHYNKAREHKLEHEMDDTEQREYGDISFTLSDFVGGELFPEDLGLTKLTFLAHNARTVEPEASTRAHPLVSARPVLPAPALALKSQRGS